MLEILGGCLTSLSFLALIIGLIKPQWLLLGISKPTRGKVIAICVGVFIIGTILSMIGRPNDFDAGKQAFQEKNYDNAVFYLGMIKATDKNYNEAQSLLKEVEPLLWKSKFDQGAEAYAHQNWSQAIKFLNDYPTRASNFDQANMMLQSAKEYLAEEKAKNEAKLQEEQMQKQQLAEQKSHEKALKKALSVFPECDSDEAETNVISAVEHSPLGRTQGYSVLKIKNIHQIGASLTERKCQGVAILNTNEYQTIYFDFIKEGNDIFTSVKFN